MIRNSGPGRPKPSGLHSYYSQRKSWVLTVVDQNRRRYFIRAMGCRYYLKCVCLKQYFGDRLGPSSCSRPQKTSTISTSTPGRSTRPVVRTDPSNPTGAHSQPIFPHSLLNVLITGTRMVLFHVNSPLLRADRSLRIFRLPRTSFPDKCAKFSPPLHVPFVFMHLRTLGSGQKTIFLVFIGFRTLEVKTQGGALRVACSDLVGMGVLPSHSLSQC